MEAVVAAASMGCMAVCSTPRRVEFTSCKSKALALPARKEFSSGTVLRSSAFTTDFQDQGHVQFYLNVQCSRKEKMNKRSAKELGKEMPNFEGRLGGMDDCKQRKKMQKMKAGKRMESSSSSSSSSESDSSDCEKGGVIVLERKEMRTVGRFREELKPESEQPKELRKGRKFDVEQFRKEWEEMSRSELMNSIPRFTPEFTIEPPISVTIEHLQKSFNLPTTRPPPPMVEDPASGRAPSSTAESPASAFSHSLVTVAGLAVVEDIIDDFSAIALKPASAHVEVCMGGKCKKAGAGEILAAFQEAGKPGVTSSACKCMKNCKSAVSIRIQDEEGDNAQVYTGVSLEDVDVLLQKHCSTGSSLTGLSSFDSELFDHNPEAQF
ncbi:hypothetical protein MPTK1_6g03620 [Marchantia polymorpha subsp. ruderalis]|nr:hypothetical protein MARPO_0035s0141 [Marchantia polymorpha]BBN13455.1 hypothetical protein Mp_6g03620 [Marchantia polymorpha subsp. ruderalis]|eukprot:PTQ41375.1 hypothetical protein MARPO_0035s0141 [Marchantia polymorpha]